MVGQVGARWVPGEGQAGFWLDDLSLGWPAGFVSISRTEETLAFHAGHRRGGREFGRYQGFTVIKGRRGEKTVFWSPERL